MFTRKEYLDVIETCYNQKEIIKNEKCYYDTSNFIPKFIPGITYYFNYEKERKEDSIDVWIKNKIRFKEFLDFPQLVKEHLKKELGL